MIELVDDNLVFSFPEVHPQARLAIALRRTLRVPDDGGTYPLPTGFRNFPVRHLDDFAARVPETWRERGGVIVPMYQAEALWLKFDSAAIPGRETGSGIPWDEAPAEGVPYPFAVKIAAGKINAVTGGPWRQELGRSPQDYVVAPKQPWLDGWREDRETVRQFVAMPLGAGYTAEEQLTGAAEYGGVQIKVYPMRRAAFDRRFPKRRSRIQSIDACYSSLEIDHAAYHRKASCSRPMGLAPGGRMRQGVFADPFDPADWDATHTSRCFVHLANSMLWRAITGENPPGVPFTAAEYARYNLPWFEHYDEEAKPLPGGDALKGVRSVAETGRDRGDAPLPENESVDADVVVNIRPGQSQDQVREEEF